VIGGEMQAYEFNNISFYTSSMTINPTAGTLSLYGQNTSNQLLQFGSAIAPANFSSGVLRSPPDLDLNLNASDSLEVDIQQLSNNPSQSGRNFVVTFDTLYGNISAFGTFSSIGDHTFSLGSLGLTDAEAADITGLSINFDEAGSSLANATVVSGLKFDTVPDGGATAALLGSALIGLAALRRKSAHA
jgi:hypothetical protein